MPQVRGVAHVHSTYSFDGQLKLKELAEFMRERGIDFVLMSEHVESLDAEKIRQFIDDCKELSSETFLLIPGVEIDALNALFYDVQPVEPWTANEDLARQFAAAGALVAVSHPVKVKTDIPKVTATMAAGVEVWNSRHDGKMAMDTRIVQFWVSLRQRLGRPLLPLCGIDFHKRHDFIPLVFELSCDTLDRQTVMASIRSGQYRIVKSGRRIPLNFSTGSLAAWYVAGSRLYRSAYKATYRVHRAIQRLGVRPPAGLRAILRRVF